MKDEIVALALSQKSGVVMATGSPLLAWMASLWGWMDINMVKLSAAAAFVLTVVMIVSHICSTIRQNREHKLNILLMEKQLREDKK